MYVWPAKTQVSLCIDQLDKASFLHTVRSVKGLNRMCCCSRTVYSALDSPAIDGKYDQRMLLSECAGAYWPESSLVVQDVLLHPVIIGVFTISEGSDQTTEICWCTVSECAGWFVSSYKFYCRFCHAQTHARVVCANLNDKHIVYNFQQTTFRNIFLILPREHYLHFMQIVSTAWNVKSCFLGNEKKKKKKKKKRKRIQSVVYDGALGPHTLLFLLIVISKFRFTISKFRHNKSKFRLNNSKFRLNILKFLIISKFRHKISKLRLNNPKFRLNILKFRLIISKFRHDISSWFFVCNSTPGNLVRGSRWLCKMKVFLAIWTMEYLFNILNKTHCNLRLLWKTQDIKFPSHLFRVPHCLYYYLKKRQ